MFTNQTTHFYITYVLMKNSEKIKKYFKRNDNENTFQMLWDFQGKYNMLKFVLRGKLIVLNVFILKRKNDIKLSWKLEKQEQKKR